MVAFWRYVVSAGLASLVDLVLVQSLLAIDLFHHGLMFGVAIAMGGLAGMSVNFVISRRFVFTPDARRTREQAVSFAIVSFTTLGLRLLVAFILAAVLALPMFAFLSALPVDAPQSRLAHLGAMGLVLAYSFLAHKHVSFAGGIRHRLATSLAVR